MITAALPAGKRSSSASGSSDRVSLKLASLATLATHAVDHARHASVTIIVPMMQQNGNLY
jgi:hypothetical protein